MRAVILVFDALCGEIKVFKIKIQLEVKQSNRECPSPDLWRENGQNGGYRVSLHSFALSGSQSDLHNAQ